MNCIDLYEQEGPASCFELLKKSTIKSLEISKVLVEQSTGTMQLQVVLQLLQEQVLRHPLSIQLQRIMLMKPQFTRD